MKRITVIGFVAALLIIASLIFWHHKQHSSIAPIMTTRLYLVKPDAFYMSLKRQIVQKDGESDLNLLRRFFQEHHIDLTNPKTSVYMSYKVSKLFVKVTPDDQDKVELLVSHIVNSK